eukprot:3446026-Amphidinium_carterae.3
MQMSPSASEVSQYTAGAPAGRSFTVMSLSLSPRNQPAALGMAAAIVLCKDSGKSNAGNADKGDTVEAFRKKSSLDASVCALGRNAASPSLSKRTQCATPDASWGDSLCNALLGDVWRVQWGDKKHGK